MGTRRIAGALGLVALLVSGCAAAGVGEPWTDDKGVEGIVDDPVVETAVANLHGDYLTLTATTADLPPSAGPDDEAILNIDTFDVTISTGSSDGLTGKVEYGEAASAYHGVFDISSLGDGWTFLEVRFQGDLNGRQADERFRFDVAHGVDAEAVSGVFVPQCAPTQTEVEGACVDDAPEAEVDLVVERVLVRKMTCRYGSCISIEMTPQEDVGSLMVSVQRRDPATGLRFVKAISAGEGHLIDAEYRELSFADGRYVGGDFDGVALEPGNYQLFIHIEQYIDVGGPATNVFSVIIRSGELPGDEVEAERLR